MQRNFIAVRPAESRPRFVNKKSPTRPPKHEEVVLRDHPTRVVEDIAENKHRGFRVKNTSTG